MQNANGTVNCRKNKELQDALQALHCKIGEKVVERCKRCNPLLYKGCNAATPTRWPVYDGQIIIKGIKGYDMARTYQGNHPDDGSGWQRAGKCYEDQDDGTDREWVVYTKRQDHSKDWMTVKVVCIGSAPKKGNYWFQFNRKTNGVGHSRDYMVLKAHRPDVFKQVMETIRDH